MKYLRIINLAIAVITIISGLLQVISPSFVLKMVGGAINPTTCQLFATIGMFMFMFGGLMVQALYSEQQNGAAIWLCLSPFSIIYFRLWPRWWLRLILFHSSC